MRYLMLGTVSLVSGGFGAWIICRWGPLLDVLAQANHRSSHDGVVPKGGGIGILAAFLFAAAVLGLPLLFWLLSGMVSLFSFYGDRKEIPAKVRLCVQFLGAIGVVLVLIYGGDRQWAGYLLIPFFSVFIVGTANYYNFMDGINGIAGIAGVVAFSLLALFCMTSGVEEALLALSICMGLACVGFLPFNMPRAHVFMGDVGSILLGFVFAAMVVELAGSVNDFVVLCSFLFPFYADELYTEYVRVKDGENLLTPHRRHIYQLLANERGVAHWKVAMGYGVLQALVGTGAMALRGYGVPVVLVFLGGCFAVFCGFGHWVRYGLEDQ